MKKLLFGALFVFSGSCCWWIVSGTSRFSHQEWDGKLEAVIQNSLMHLGVNDSDLLSRLNIEKSDDTGRYVFQKLGIRLANQKKLDELGNLISNAGGEIQKNVVNGKTTYKISKGKRIYGEIIVSK